MKRDDPAAGLLVIVERLTAQVETLATNHVTLLERLTTAERRVSALESKMQLLEPIG